MALQSRPSSEPLWTKSFIMLILGNLFVFMGFQMLLPVMPAYIQSIGAVLIRPYIGYLLEFKRHRPLVLIGALSLLVMTVLYPITQIVVLFLLIRFVHGLAWGWSTTTNGTAAVDVVPNSRLGEGVGYYGLSITIGMIIAPSLGIYLFQYYHFNLIIAVSAILCFLAFILLALAQDRTPNEVVQTKPEQVKFSFIGSMIEKNSWYPALVTLTSTFGYGAIVTFIVIFGEERNIEQIYFFYLFNALTATLIRPITGRWFDRKGPIGLIIFCASLTFVALWVLSWATSSVYIVVSGILFGAGYGSLLPTLQAWVLAKTAPERRGVANGMFYSGIDLGVGLSGFVFGIIAQFVDTGTLFQISSLCFVVVILLTLFSREKEGRKESHPV